MINRHEIAVDPFPRTASRELELELVAERRESNALARAGQTTGWLWAPYQVPGVAVIPAMPWIGPGRPTVPRSNNMLAMRGTVGGGVWGSSPDVIMRNAPGGVFGGGGGSFGNWGDILVGGANVIGAYFDRKQQRKLLAQQAKAARRAARAAMPMPQPGYVYGGPNINPNLGGTAPVGGGSMLSFGGVPSGGTMAYGDLASWQTAPIDPGGLTWDPSGGVPMSTASMVPAVIGAAGVAARAVGIGAIARTLMKYLAPAAAVELAQALAFDGASVGGPYRTESLNKALAYRGDLAAIKRVRKLASVIGSARATGMRRSLPRRRRR